MPGCTCSRRWETRGEQVPEALRVAAEASSPTLRARAAFSLRSEEATALLLRIAADPEEMVRASARDLLERRAVGRSDAPATNP